MSFTRRLAVSALAGLLIAAVAVTALTFTLPTLQAKIGTIVLSVTDSNADASNKTVSAVYLTIDEIIVHRNGTSKVNETRDWITISIPKHTIELLSLRNLTDNFPQIMAAKLPAGTYNEIRLHVAAALATMNSVNQTVMVPSGMLKIPELQIVISDGGVTTILIDIGYESVNVNRSLILRPVAHILSQSHP